MPQSYIGLGDFVVPTDFYVDVDAKHRNHLSYLSPSLDLDDDFRIPVLPQAHARESVSSVL